MRNGLIYFFVGIACLGVGAAFYIVAGNVSATSHVLRGVPDSRSTIKSVTPAKAGVQKQTTVDFGLRRNDEHKPASIFFAGDIMLGRSVAQQMMNNGQEYPFAKIKDIISSTDYAIANLEGPLTKINNSPANNMVFHFDPTLAPILSDAGFDAFSLANNHGFDQGSKGAADTKNNLAANHLQYFGEVSTDEGQVLNFEIRGKKFAVIGLHDVYHQIDPVVVAELIKVAKKDGAYVIIYPHWGSEYEHEYNARQTKLAHAFIDAGADLVVGSHPHVIQGIEAYKGKMIFYSLGNLVFDQYFSVDTQQGLALRMNIGVDGKFSFELLPYEIPKSQPVFASGDKRTKILQDLASWSATELKDQIWSGNISIQ